MVKEKNFSDSWIALADISQLHRYRRKYTIFFSHYYDDNSVYGKGVGRIELNWCLLWNYTSDPPVKFVKMENYALCITFEFVGKS